MCEWLEEYWLTKKGIRYWDNLKCLKLCGVSNSVARIRMLDVLRNKGIQSSSVIASSKGLNIVCYYKRRTAGYTLFDHKRNEEILEELEVEPVDKKLREYTNQTGYDM